MKLNELSPSEVFSYFEKYALFRMVLGIQG